MSRYLAIDIDGVGLCVATGAARGSALVVERMLHWTDGSFPLTSSNASSLGVRFRESLKAEGISVNGLLVAVGRERVILKDLRYPPVPVAEEPNLVRFQAMKDIVEAPEDVLLDYVPSGESGNERKATVVILKRDEFETIRSFAASAGLKLLSVTPRPFTVAAALRRALRSGTTPLPPNANSAIAVVFVGPHGGEFSVIHSDQIIFTRTISPLALSNTENLIAELKRNLVLAEGTNNSVGAVYFVESESHSRAEQLSRHLSIPVHVFDPLTEALTPCPADLAGRLASAVGLLALKTADSFPINFVFPRQPKAEIDPTKKGLLWGALAAVLLLGLGAVYGYAWQSRNNQAYSIALARKKSVEDDLARIEVDVRRLQAAEDWSKREVVWLDELYDLFCRFTDIDRSRISSLTAQSLPVDKAGKQPAQARLEVNINASSAEPVNALLSAFDRDNHSGAKYYINPAKTVLGTASGTNAGALNLLFRISTLVNRRLPEEFTRSLTVSAPPEPTRIRAQAPDSPSDNPSQTFTPKNTPAKAQQTESKTPGFKAPNYNDDWFIR